MRILITGVNGFVGPYLTEHILAADHRHRVVGLAWGEGGRDDLAPFAPRLRVVDLDLTRPDALQGLLADHRPELVFHLAAASSVASSWSAQGEFMRVNAIGQINLFEALLASGLRPRVVVSSSAEVYGRVDPSRLPVTEEEPLDPITPYGVSKAAQDLIARQYFQAHGLSTIRLRLFNHTGPRRPSTFALSGFARQVAEIERARRPALVKVGDLEVVRDFSDVRDVVGAYWLAAVHAEPGSVFNVCSGEPHRLGEALDLLASLSHRPFRVETDPGRLRPVDVPALYGDPRRLAAATGWTREIPFEQTVADLLDWWRSRA